MTITDYGAAAWSGIMFGIGSLPANFYLCLLTAEPGDGWDGTVLTTVEPADAAYARQPLAVPGDWVLSDGGYVTNANEVAFPMALEDWGIITHFALTDDLAAGNLWSYSWLLDQILVPAGYPPNIDVGSVFHSLGNQQPTIAE